MKSSTSWLLVTISLILSTLASPSYSAIWTGDGADASWGDEDNWGGTLPAFDNTTVIDFDPTSGFDSGVATLLGVNRQMLTLEIGVDQDFSIGTAAESLLLRHIHHQSTTVTAQHIINSNIILQGDGVWTMAGDTGARMRISGVISDGGNGYSIDLTTAGTNRRVRLDSANTYTGGTTIHAATLELGNSSALGTGPISFNDIVQLIAVSGALTFTNDIEFAGTVRFGSSGSNPAVTFNGPIELSNNVALSNTGQAELGYVTLNGDITETGGSRSLSLTFGNRTVILNGNNSYTGGTTLSGAGGTQTTHLIVGHNNALGTGAVSIGSPSSYTIEANTAGVTLDNAMNLNLDAGMTLTLGGNGTAIAFTGVWSGGGGDIIVASNATLGGTGAIVGDITLQSGATLSPGASTGILSMAGAITLTTTVTFDVELEGLVAGAGYDQLQVISGSIDLGSATLQLTDNDFNSGGAETMLAIINNSDGATLTGMFNGLANGDLAVTIGDRDFYIYYNANYGSLELFGGNDVVLFAEALPVPEPATFWLASSLLVVVVRRKKQWAAKRDRCRG